MQIHIIPEPFKHCLFRQTYKYSGGSKCSFLITEKFSILFLDLYSLFIPSDILAEVRRRMSSIQGKPCYLADANSPKCFKCIIYSLDSNNLCCKDWSSSTYFNFFSSNIRADCSRLFVCRFESSMLRRFLYTYFRADPSSNSEWTWVTTSGPSKRTELLRYHGLDSVAHIHKRFNFLNILVHFSRNDWWLTYMMGPTTPMSLLVRVSRTMPVGRVGDVLKFGMIRFTDFKNFLKVHSKVGVAFVCDVTHQFEIVVSSDDHKYRLIHLSLPYKKEGMSCRISEMVHDEQQKEIALNPLSSVLLYESEDMFVL